MPPFRFKLQALLKLAEQQEQGMRREMAKANAAVEQVRSRLDATSRTYMKWEEKLRATQARRLVAPEVRHQVHTLAALRERLEHLRSDLRAAEAAAEEVRRRLNEAVCRRKSLDRLRSRMKEAHEADMAARKNRSADDMAATRAADRRRNGAGNAITGAPR